MIAPPGSGAALTVVTTCWDSYVRYLPTWLDDLERVPLALRAVLVDNASTVPLPELPASVQVVRLGERVSVGAARNAGLAATATEAVVFHDVDDRLLPAVVPLLLAALGARRGRAVATSATVKQDPDGTRRPRPLPRTTVAMPWAPALAVLVNLHVNVVLMAGGTVARTESVRDAGGFADGDYGEDWVLSTRLLLRGRLAVLPVAGVVWCRHAGSLWHRPHPLTELLAARARVRAALKADPACPRWLRVTLPLHAVAHGVRARRLARRGAPG